MWLLELWGETRSVLYTTLGNAPLACEFMLDKERFNLEESLSSFFAKCAWSRLCVETFLLFFEFVTGWETTGASVRDDALYVKEVTESSFLVLSVDRPFDYEGS